MTTVELADQYLSERETSAHYKWFLRRIARQLESAGVRQADEFCETSVNAWLQGLHDLSSTTRANMRRGALVLWHYAASQGLTDHPTQRLMKVKQKLRPPVASWSGVSGEGTPT